MKNLFEVDEEDYSKIHTDKIIYICVCQTLETWTQLKGDLRITTR